MLVLSHPRSQGQPATICEWDDFVLIDEERLASSLDAIFVEIDGHILALTIAHACSDDFGDVCTFFAGVS